MEYAVVGKWMTQTENDGEACHYSISESVYDSLLPQQFVTDYIFKY